MPQQAIVVHDLQAAQIHIKINLLIDNLVNITDTSGKFLLRLDDGRIIDTKGWNDWEYAGCGLKTGIILTIHKMDPRHRVVRSLAVSRAHWLS